MSVDPDGWAVIARPEETFAREILAKMAEFVPTRRDLINVPAHQDTMEAIVSLRGRRAMAHPVATEGPAWTAMMEQTLDAAALPEQQAKLVSKTLVTNVLIILAKTKVIALTKWVTTIALANLNGVVRTVTLATVPVPEALTNPTADTYTTIRTRKNKSVSNTNATAKPAIIVATKSATPMPATTTVLIVAWVLILGNIVTPPPGEESPVGKSSRTADVTRLATPKNVFLMDEIAKPEPKWSAIPTTMSIVAITLETVAVTWPAIMPLVDGTVWIVNQ